MHMENKSTADVDDIISEIIHDVRQLEQYIKVCIDRSVRSLKEQNTGMADRLIENKKKVSVLGDIIEDKCTQTLTLKVSPVQLRTLKGILRIVIDLENIKNLSIDIAFITKATYHSPHIKPLVDIPRMSVILQEMMEGGLEALEKRDAEMAKKIAMRDDEIDALFDQVRRELITYMIEDPTKITNASHLTFASRYLERMGDHMINLCERVVYIVTGLKVDLNQ